MKYTKILLALVSLVLLVSVVSAMSLSFSTASVPTSVSQSAGSFNVILSTTNSGADGDVSFSHTVNSGSASITGVSYSPSSTININNSQSRNVTATVSFSSSQTGTFGITFSADDITGSGATQTTTISVPITTSSNQFCDAGAKGTNLSISSVDISSSGDDDEEWRPLDKIEVEVEVENDGDSDLEDVYVELGIFDNNNDDVTNEFEFSNTDEEKIKLGDLDEGDDDSAIFEFQVPGDLDDGTYKVVAKVYSRDAGESNLCADSFSENIVETVSIEAEDDEGKYIAFDEIEFSPTEATCGESVTMNFDVLNIGEDDQDQVKVTVSSKDLQINQVIEFTQDIDRGDKESASITFTVPTGLTDKLYTIEIDAEYDYDDGLYEERLDDAHKMSYKVFGCSVSNTPKVAIGATLASDAVPGKELVVRSTITNTDSKAGTYIIDVSSLGSWATLDSISERIFTLNAGETKTVQITLVPNKDASGDQSFNIDVKSGDKTESRQVVVSLGNSSAGLFSSLGENKLAWIIGIINVVLIVLIILVAIKISRR